MQKTPKEELDRRIKALQARLSEAKVEGALIVQNADLYYFTGTVPQGWLFVPSDGHPILFIRKNPNRVRSETSLEHLFNARNTRELAGVLADKGYRRFRRLGMELDILPVNQYARYMEALKPAEIVDVSPVIQGIRSVKSPFEIAIIRQSAKLGDHMMRVARESIREGMTELELSARIEMAARMRGHQGYVRMRGFNAECYWGPVVSGASAAEPAFVDTTEGGYGTSLALPAGAGHRVIARHEPVVVDMAATVGGYNADITRTFSLGRLPEKMEVAYRESLEILQVLAGAVHPGVVVSELYLKAEKLAEKKNLLAHFMGYGNDKAGFCGHGLGLELDEPPVISRNGKAILVPGNVLALEPKFTFPGEGVVGVEDVFLVTENGAEKLTKSGYGVKI
ncbi:MAG: Xaa-Pro peptidase family protein [Pseudomonadota bacterium]|nr:aminopeptidase P family protein [Syntrophobacterales bacterium]MDI9554604.1 Xaa-Pro peptidase family protein [Pseudomonadota bacterium]NLX31311.1 aminopeptidase P family protein [Deltaproteobacteria bacterium]HNU85438.1 Xaa-Pro peptidase family protein [Syntrophales bacterium]HOF72594.1 Xaa-Pro peptidase family protein [Syntrophales bacterium]